MRTTSQNNKSLNVIDFPSLEEEVDFSILSRNQKIFRFRESYFKRKVAARTCTVYLHDGLRNRC